MTSPRIRSAQTHKSAGVTYVRTCRDCARPNVSTTGRAYATNRAERSRSPVEIRIRRRSPRIKNTDASTITWSTAMVKPCWTSPATDNATRRAATTDRDANVGAACAANGHPVLPFCRASCITSRGDLSPFVAGGQDTMVGAVGVDEVRHDFLFHG